MDYGDTYPDSIGPLKSQSRDIAAVNVPAEEILSCKPAETDLANSQEPPGHLKKAANEPDRGATQGHGAARGPAAGVLQQAANGPAAFEIKHPLAAIMANANAAGRWLKRPDSNLAEALAALDRIVKDCARIDALIEAVGATIVEEAHKTSAT